uniref:F-box domain-containing protein n=1 Tax=Kalanchoe fedtschenkoi TaxID=63787 RepID=A0A7N0VF72_KALFE
MIEKLKKKPMMHKKTGSESGAETELCEDLIREILLKLPVKSLLRFSQVSKTWLQIIRSNSFISNHYSVAKSRRSGPTFFIIRNAISDEVDSFVTQVSTEAGRIRIGQNIHLRFPVETHARPQMFPAGFGVYFICKLSTDRVALWNHGTRKLEVVPPSPLSGGSYLCFGQVEFNHDGFSYKTAAGVNLNGISSDLEKECEDINGYKEEDDNEYDYDDHIMTFDYSGEVFGRIELPDFPPIIGRYNLMHESFLILNDDMFLRLVIRWKNDGVHDEDFLDVRVMHEYGVKESWSKEYTVGPISQHMRMLGYLKSAGGFLLRDCDYKRYLFNCASLSVERFHHVDFDELKNIKMIERTVESLIPLRGPPAGLK